MPQSTAPVVGQPMPDIPVVLTDGSSSSLAALRGDERTVYYFMRTATCPVCLSHVRKMSTLLAAGDLPAGSVVVVAPGDVDQALLARARAADPALTVVASGDHHADAGLGRFLMVQHSGTFVVDASGIVRAARAGALPTSSFSEAEALAVW